MTGDVLDLSGAYDDTPRHDDSMFTTSPRGIAYNTSRHGTPRDTPPTLPWRSSTAPAHLQVTNSPYNYDDYGQAGSRFNSPLPLPAPSRSPLGLGGLRSPPPSCAQASAFGDGLDNSKTPYDVLGISEYASAEEIKAAYKKKALKHHPDKYPQDEQSQEEAKAKFQRIAEAFALLADPKRRAEYDILRKQGKGASQSSAYGGKTSSRKPTFKSTFTPDISGYRSPYNNFERDDRVDLTDLDPFHLFDRMFPDMAKGFNNFTKPLNSQTADADLAPINGFRNPPPVAEFGSSMRPGSSRKMNESYQRAHMDKRGNLQVSQGQRSMRVHKSGGFTFESSTFSASTTGGDMGKLQAMIASMNGFGASNSAGGSLGFGGSMFGGPAVGYPDIGPPLPSSRSRRQSFGALEDSYRPPSPNAGFSPSHALQRRPSFSFQEPLAIGNSPANYDSSALAPYGSSDRSLGRSRLF